MEALLIDIEPRPSRLNGGTYYRLNWVNVDHLTTWETDVQDSYDNWEKNGWRDIVENRRYGYYSGLKCKKTQTRTGVGVITADSYPQLEYSVATRRLAVEVVEEAIVQRERINANNTFDEIFAPRN
jgi:hypothetical protein